MAKRIELETRIRELERRLENDEQDMVEVCDRIEKLESGVKKRLMELEDTPVYQMALINELRKNHDALCDALIKYSAVVDDEDGYAYDEAINRARIDTRDTEALLEHWQKTQPTIISESDMEATLGGRYIKPQEAQDEPERAMVFCGGNDGGGNDSCGDTGVDELMGEIQQIMIDADDKGMGAMYTRAVSRDNIKPIIEKLVGERHGRLAMARARYEKAEAERDEYRRSSNDWARHFKSERTARINAEAEVARLREEMGKCVRMAKNAGYGPARTMADKLLKALAEGNDNG